MMVHRIKDKNYVSTTHMPPRNPYGIQSALEWQDMYTLVKYFNSVRGSS